MRGEPVELIARHQARSETLPYERLLHDAIQDDPTLFTRDDSAEAAWTFAKDRAYSTFTHQNA